MAKGGFSALKNLSFLRYRYKAEEASASLPAMIAAAERAAGSVFSGEHAQRRPGMGEKFWQYREYNVSDRPQDIDWRQSAKGDRVFVREKEWQTTQTALVWCQRNGNMDFRSAETLPAKQETGLVIALALSLLLRRAGEQIAALEGSALPGRSELTIQKLGESLAQAQTGDLPGGALRKIPPRSSLILVGDFLAPLDDIVKTFDLLATPAENALLVQVLDPAELSLPYEGRVIFKNSGTEDRHHIENVETVRAAYRERLAAHMDSIKTYCKKHRWHWLLHTTDEDIRKTLFDAWMMMTPESFHMGAPR